MGEAVLKILKFATNPAWDPAIELHFNKIRKVLLTNFVLIQLVMSDFLVFNLRKMQQTTSSKTEAKGSEQRKLK